jgi:hypothetical protein
MGAVTIVIDDAFAPCGAESGIFATRENGGVFHGYAALIKVAVEGPSLQLAARQLAFVHQGVEGMPVMITLFAYSVESGDELWFREHVPFRGDGHSRNSMPS